MDEKRKEAIGADASLDDIINEVKRENEENMQAAAPETWAAAEEETPAPQIVYRHEKPSRYEEPDDAYEKKPKRGKSTGKYVAIGVAAAAAALIAAAFGYTYLYPNIYFGVHAGGIELAGLSQEKAVEEIDAARYSRLKEAEVELNIDDKLYEIEVSKVAKGLDSKATAEAAAAYGRSGNPFVRVGAAVGALFGGHEVGLTVDIDKNALTKRLDEISNEALQPAKDPTYTIENDELVIDSGTDGVDFDRKMVGEAAAEKIRQMDFTPYKVKVETEKPGPIDLDKINAEIVAEPRNAIVDKSDGKTIIPEQNGIQMDLEQAKKIVGDGSEKTYRVPLKLTAPKVTAQQLAEVLFRDTLASTSTGLNAGNRARTNNVRLACEFINGIILNPGEEFSYNGTVGQRTAARGFKSAGAYMNGRVVDEVGGGVCQPSSTLYMAVLRADLEVTQRKNHTFTVAYTPLGEDATVSWGGPDFRFRNNTDYPVRIYASQTGGSCNMKIVGTKTSDKKVETHTDVLSTKAFAVVEKPDPSLAPGATKVDQTGTTGYNTVTYKIITENGETRKVKANSSSYSKRDKIILKGPAAPVEPPKPPVNPPKPVEPPKPPVNPPKPAEPPVTPPQPPVDPEGNTPAA